MLIFMQDGVILFLQPYKIEIFAANARPHQSLMRLHAYRLSAEQSTNSKSSSETHDSPEIMNSVHQIRNAVANIQDELQRILVSSEVLPLEHNHVAEEFKTKLIGEFNTKLRGFKSKIRVLNEENAQLKEQVRDLKRQLDRKSDVSRLTKSVGSLPRGPDMAPPKRLRKSPENERYNSGLATKSPELPHNYDEERVEIISSPIKPLDGQDLGKHETTALGSRDITSSQFNRMPTQYSDTSDSARENLHVDLGATKFVQLQHPDDNVEDNDDGEYEIGEEKAKNRPEDQQLPKERAKLDEHIKKRKRRSNDSLGSSPIKAIFIEEDDRVVADSQDEYEPLGERPAGYPQHYTALQRIDFLRNYYRMKLSDLRYSVNLTNNPITEKPWVFADFKPNGNWTRPKHLHSHVGVMTKAQERAYTRFFQEAGHGVKGGGPQWEQEGNGREEPIGGVMERGGREKYEKESSEGDRIGRNTKGDQKHATLADEFHDSSDNWSEKENSQGSDQWIKSQIMDKYLSPPGYMVALFPSTQQQQQNKQMVANKSRQRLERRVDSALSQGEFVFYEEVLNTYVAEGRYTKES